MVYPLLQQTNGYTHVYFKYICNNVMNIGTNEVSNRDGWAAQSP
jgi:hypothetical protein